MANIDPFGRLMESERWIASDKLQRQQLARQNALQDVQQQSAQLGLQSARDKQNFLVAARTGGLESALQQYPVIGPSMVQQQKGASQRGFAPVTLYNQDTNEYQMVMPSFDPSTGSASLSNLDIPQGFSVLKEDPLVKRQRDVESAAEKERRITGERGIATQATKTIEAGIDASRGLASVNRGLELLDQLQTGGIDKVALTAKQYFGIESGDEAELSGLLGKAVLSQLRATFGAAFTENEGNRLAAIEASFTKSTEGNKRLLRNAQQIMERAAKRGMAAAKSRKDDLSYEEIKKNMEFRLGGKPEEKKPEEPIQSPPIQGATLAPDGNYYIERNGEFYRVEQ